MLGPVAFPRNPYHQLLKHCQDGQLRRGQANNPELVVRLALKVFGHQRRALSEGGPGHDASVSTSELTSPHPWYERTRPLRHVHGFSVLGLLRILRFISPVSTGNRSSPPLWRGPTKWFPRSLSNPSTGLATRCPCNLATAKPQSCTVTSRSARYTGPRSSPSGQAGRVRVATQLRFVRFKLVVFS